MRVAVCGIEGPVVDGFLEQLESLGEEVTSLAAYAVAPEEMASLRFDGKTVYVRPLAEADFSEHDILLVFEAVESLEALAEAANAVGCHLLDVGSQAPTGGRVVVPELMAGERVDYPVFWSLPDPVVSAIAPVLDGLLAGNTLKRLAALVCQPASAQGPAGTKQLAAETARLLNGQPVESAPGPQLAFNLLPGDLNNAAISLRQLEDLLGIELPAVGIETLQVPLFYGQTIQLQVELDRPFSRDSAAEIWTENGLHLVENKNEFTPVALVEDDRIHLHLMQHSTAPRNSLSLWVIADNVRKSAVVNTIKLMEILIKSSI